jgi:peptidoglycan/LPS O-acetylase OafA/YrhL
MPSPPRLAYLDGLRGIAALYVVVHHAYYTVLEVGDVAVLPAAVRACLGLLGHGHLAVGVFIVLSGYVLMLPVARDGQLKGGVRGYLARRSRRILPPYYAALALTLLLIHLVPALGHVRGRRWDYALPVTPGAVAAHLLLIHDLSPHWLTKINYPHWSVAVEWQIYFLFPGLLLLWRRFGMGLTLAAALSAGFAPALILPQTLGGACPWYLGLFAVGMAAALVNVSPDPLTEQVRLAMPWGLAAASLGATLALTALLQPDALERNPMLVDLCLGGWTAGSLVAWTEQAARGGSRVVRFFEHPRMVGLGKLSYSLYLTHAPVLALVDLGLAGLSPAERLVRVPVAGVIASLMVGAGFATVFERPNLLSSWHPARLWRRGGHDPQAGRAAPA